ncbi:uncharacterized protein PGRI_030320 [Penicillium griseofulvum]|uniref:Uncharacterized protein n=1 Tax=Penicillium patulum TaxID=5078 RepID=A0A135LJL2_PENPA|nr:uncharacterized protein PGRI_030320 [Penicillium griseofulvum]KXG49162.1 hypothetical protein PGRI_030320 [Penicillium griseofulvum]
MQLNRPSILTLVLILAVTRSTTSHPIGTSKWVKTEQFKDPNARGIWKVFEKDPYDQLPDPPHVKYNGNPAWSTSQNNDPLDQDTTNDRYAIGTSEAGKPTVSILIPTSAEIPEEMHKHYSQHTEENEHYFSQENTINVPAAQTQDQYSEILHYLYTKNTLHNAHNHASPTSSSHSSSRYLTSFFIYRFSFPALRSKVMMFPHYHLPGTFTTVIILLVMVWVAIFTIGLLELGNYLWRRRGQTLVSEGDRVPDSEERNLDLDETMKVPLRIITAPSAVTRPHSVGEHGYDSPVSIYSDSKSNSGSESDEDDYRIL